MAKTSGKCLITSALKDNAPIGVLVRLVDKNNKTLASYDNLGSECKDLDQHTDVIPVCDICYDDKYCIVNKTWMLMRADSDFFGIKSEKDMFYDIGKSDKIVERIISMLS